MEFEKVDGVPNKNLTEEDMKAIKYLNEMKEGEAVKTEESAESVKRLTRAIKGKKFRVYKRTDGIYVKRMPEKEEKNKEE